MNGKVVPDSAITGLLPNKDYYFWIEATSAEGTRSGTKNLIHTAYEFEITWVSAPATNNTWNNHLLV